jgi:hypothetical protein
MKFKYDDNGDARKCVAYIDGDELHIKTDDGCVVFYDNGNVHQSGYEMWDDYIKTATHKFYPGDKITITF